MGCGWSRTAQPRGIDACAESPTLRAVTDNGGANLEDAIRGGPPEPIKARETMPEADISVDRVQWRTDTHLSPPSLTLKNSVRRQTRKH
jgi:hypothetical protein